ncbi:MAG: CocE/NonD family hydrolase [Gordonia sp. (in: high G+C Gram-positive bacteria)]|uniref:CocE/NonD family hydrolase n=1 Tax=Gordonia sp. (in: high G+C Gram-positive bacteria) TaxID=84139 RepID=UPI0039E28635
MRSVSLVMRRLLIFLIVPAIVIGGSELVPAAQAPSQAAVYGALGKKWTKTADAKPKYPNHTVTPDVTITMSDGVKLRGNLVRPADAQGRPINKKMPVIVNMTPYTKMVSALAAEVVNYPVLMPQLIALLNAINLRGTVISGYNELMGALNGGLVQTFAYDPKLVQSGYDMLVVDVRGTGFSQGLWGTFDARERQDTVEVVRWAKKQKWSNGKVGMAGVSYSGINQLQAAADAPGELDAIFPVVPGGDLVNDIVAPGGGVGFGFLALWLTLVNSMKMIPNLASMLNGTFDWKWLADRAKDPLTFFDVMIEALTTRDVKDYHGKTKTVLDSNSERRKMWYTDVGKITTPTFAIGGWNDLFTNTESRLLTNLTQLPSSEKKLIMDDGYHITSGSNFGQPGHPPRLDVLSRAWYDHFLKGVDNGIDRYDPATLASEPAGNFIQAQTYPIPGYQHQRQFLSGRSSGTEHTPVAGDGSLSSGTPAGRATREVKPGLSPMCSVDGAQAAAGVTAFFDFCGRDTRLSEVAAQTFTSAPAKQLTRISGTPAIHLNQRLNATDGYWHATVNVVHPDGRSQIVSMGQLVVSLRDVDAGRSQYDSNGDLTDVVLSMDIGKYKKVTPGQTLAVDIPMSATQAALKPGDRLRVDVYSFNFPKSLPLGPELWSSQLRPQYIEIDPKNPSWVNLPVDKPLR